MRLSKCIVNEIQKLGKKYGVVSIRVFGSYLNNKNNPDSDIDLLVTLKPESDLLDLIGFKQEVEKLVGVEVDVVTEQSLSPYFREQVLKDAVPI